MLLSALLLAATVQAAPPPLMQTPPGRVIVYASKDEAMEAIRKQAACRTQGLQLAGQPPPNVQAKVRRLGDLPPANHTLTVLRSVDGCPVSSTVRYNVGR